MHTELRHSITCTLFAAANLYTEIRKWSAYAFVAVLIPLMVTTPAAAAVDTLPEFDATYTVRYGILRGTMDLHLRHRENGFDYETSLRPRGIVTLFRRGVITEKTALVNADDTVRPLDYESTDTIADPVRHTRYRFGGDRVTGEYKSRSIDEPMQPNGHNRISVQVAILLALHLGKDITEVSVFNRARWKSYQFEVLPNRILELSTGTYNAIEVRYASPGSTKNWSLYVAPELSYLPVMLVYREDQKIKSSAELESYRISP